MTASGEPPHDPVRARRATVAKWNTIATRVGYLLFLIAIVMFFIALATDFSSGKVANRLHFRAGDRARLCGQGRREGRQGAGTVIGDDRRL